MAPHTSQHDTDTPTLIPVSFHAHVKNYEIRRVMKPFHVIPTLELPKDRDLCLFSTGPSQEPGGGKVLRKRTAPVYRTALIAASKPTPCLVTANASLEAAPDPSLLPAMGHRSRWWKLQGSGWL